MDTKKKKVFMVEDDESFGSVLQSYLELNGYYVYRITDGKKALWEFKQDDFDICIFDVMLPNIDGFTVAQKIKDFNENIPFIFLTAKSMRDDVVKGLQIGADDYITKPFDSEILLLKLKAVLKRNNANEEPEQEVYRIGNFTFNHKTRLIEIGDKTHKLSPKEADLLKLLCDNKNNITDRDKALKKIWKDSSFFTTRSMDVYMTKIRKHLKDDPSVKIENIHGSGFILQVEE